MPVSVGGSWSREQIVVIPHEEGWTGSSTWTAIKRHIKAKSHTQQHLKRNFFFPVHNTSMSTLQLSSRQECPVLFFFCTYLYICSECLCYIDISGCDVVDVTKNRQQKKKNEPLQLFLRCLYSLLWAVHCISCVTCNHMTTFFYLLKDNSVKYSSQVHLNLTEVHF